MSEKTKVKHAFGLMDCEMQGADPCACGMGYIPKRAEGVIWYWQRHSRKQCTLELPDKQCWCGLKRSEHIDGHRETA